jgi:transcriptional regulator with XRE-family HTH domain
MALGENIKSRREELKLSQEYIAEQLGVSRQAISKWETGQSEPTASNLIQLAEILELNLSELVDPQKNNEEPSTSENERHKKEPNLILRANLTKIAIIAHAAILFNCTSVFYQLRHPDPDYPNQELYMGALIFSLILLALSSIWMATNHRYETDKNQRRKNVNIELGYCCIQLLVGLLTIQFGLGLVGAAMIIAVTSVYILYINPKFMSRKLTK